MKGARPSGRQIPTIHRHLVSAGQELLAVGRILAAQVAAGRTGAGCYSIGGLRGRPRLARPPVRPAALASSFVHWCAVPFAWAAFPPRLAIRRRASTGIQANPRLIFGMSPPCFTTAPAACGMPSVTSPARISGTAWHDAVLTNVRNITILAFVPPCSTSEPAPYGFARTTA